jgi:GT2 family glycosyltransferase
MLNWIYPPDITTSLVKKQFGRYLIHYGFTSLKGWNKASYWDDNRIFPVEGITSQYLSIIRADFLISGGYNESFPHAGYEDFEFAQRLKKLKKSLYVYPMSMVYHNEIDRLELDAWLARKKRGSETRKAAVNMGYTELALNHGKAKKMLLKFLILLKPVLQYLLHTIPNKRSLDFIYFKLVNILLATVIFEGYHRE